MNNWLRLAIVAACVSTVAVFLGCDGGDGDGGDDSSSPPPASDLTGTWAYSWGPVTVPTPGLPDHYDTKQESGTLKLTQSGGQLSGSAEGTISGSAVVLQVRGDTVTATVSPDGNSMSGTITVDVSQTTVTTPWSARRT